MKTPFTKRSAKWTLRVRYYGHYVDDIGELESVLARKPATLRIDMIGSGEIGPDTALLMRSVLLNRSPRTHLVTHARSSLQNASVLIWLMGDTRLIRDDANLLFRATGAFAANANSDPAWRDSNPLEEDEEQEEDSACLEESAYFRVLQCIDEYLPVKEMAGRVIESSVLRQFGLVDNRHLDRFLASSFRKRNSAEAEDASTKRKPRPARIEVPK